MRALPVVLVLVIALAPVAVRADGWRDRLGTEPRVRALQDADRGVRIDAARWLGQRGDPERAIEALIEALGTEREADVRARIADALARRRDPRAIPVLSTAVLSAGVTGMRPIEQDARLGALAAIDVVPARRALAAALGGPGARLALPRIVELGAPMIDELMPLLDLAAAPPPMRTAVLEALFAIGGPRVAPIALAALGDPEISIVVSALRALARASAGEGVEGVEGLEEGAISDAIAGALDRSEPAVIAAALDALARIDPLRALPRIERALAGDDGPLARDAARRAVLDAPDAAFAPLLTRLARESGDAVDALGRLSGGAGRSALVDLARAGSGEARLAIAIAARRDRVGDVEREALRAEADPLRRELLRAIARDHEVAPELVRRIERGTPEERTLAAQGLELLGDGGDDVRRALEVAITQERDGIALEALARALDGAGGSIDPSIPVSLVDPALAAARLILASIARPTDSAEMARALRRIPRDALRAPEPRVRAGAMLALARTGADDAAIAISRALEDSASEVRLAAARALHALGALTRASIAERAASRLAIEPDARVRRALREALAQPQPTPRTRGDRCLAVRLERPSASSIVAIEVVLEDGRWLRERSLGTGELVICDLPSGDADVLLPP